jgi:L-fuculose-phosphate aldolase
MTPPGREASEQKARRDIVEVIRRVYARGWIAATDGNISALLSPDRVLATPTGINKGSMTEDDLIVVDRQGQRVSGTRAPSSELRMHLAAYDERPDVRAVVHAHPTNCIAFSLAGVSLAQCLLPEIVFTFGSIPTTAYTTPTTEEVPREIRRWVRDFDAMILDRHGSLTVGPDVFAAYDKLERMEHVAEITFRARQLGPLRPLLPDQIAHLQAVGRGLGLPEKKILPAPSPCDHCNACPASTMGKAGSTAAEAPARAEARTEARDVDEMVRRVSATVGQAIVGAARRPR